MTALIKECARKFMEHNPDVPISVGSGDSGEGIAALINQTTDLAAASRDLTADEEKLARSRGVKLKKITVARDSIAVIVNNKNPVTELSLADLKAIFAGSARSWKQFGGPAKAITVCIREPNSGTADYFKSHVLNGDRYAAGAAVLPSADDAVKLVESNQNAIAYVGMSRANTGGAHVKVVSLKLTERSKAVSPTESSTTGDYPLSRPLLMFVDANHKGSADRFINFCVSKEGQDLVAQSGFARAVGD